MRDVAKLAGVSVATVSRVLNRQASASSKTGQAVMRAVQTLGYRPDAAFGLAFKRQRQRQGLRGEPVATRTLGYLASSSIQVAASHHDGFYGDVVSGFNEVAHHANYHMMWGILEPDQTELPACVLEDRVDGVVVGGSATEAVRQQLARRLPTVFVGRPYQARFSSCVLPNYTHAVGQQMDYLWGLGHRNIACFVPQADSYGYREVARGFVDFHRDRGVAIASPALCEPRDISPQTHGRVLRAYAREILAARPRPTAVLSFHGCAATLIGDLQTLGLDVPHDISVIGLNETPVAGGQGTTPPLTSWQMPMAAMGRAAAHLLLDHIKTKDQPQQCVLVSGHRSERVSCAPPPAPRPECQHPEKGEVMA